MKRLAYAIAITAILSLSGCSLPNMIKAAQEQDLTVTPNPLEVHANTVDFELAANLPVKMLKKGKVYTINTFYKAGDNEKALESIEFKADDYPNSGEEQPRQTKSFSFPYDESLKSGVIEIQGVASDPKSAKVKETPRMEVAQGIITTSTLVESVYFAAYADHGYNNKEELEPVNIDFFFLQGRSDFRYSERTGERGKELEAFIADKNATKSVTITGSHSPEGTERINSKLAEERAKKIEAFYVKNMKKYDYKGLADSINFIIKPVIDDWTAFKAELNTYEGISSEEKSSYLSIVNGAGSFEEKEKSLRKLASYKKVFKDVYPKLRAAKTGILKIKVKKTDAEMSVLAKQISEGAADSLLTEEELMYAASLTPSLKEKEAIYTAATKKSDSWNSHNNLAAVYIAMASEDPSNATSLAEKAATQLEIANNKKESAEAYANLGSVYLIQGNAQKSYDALTKAGAMGASNDVTKGLNGVKASTEIMLAKYADAISSGSSSEEKAQNLFNKGLAQLLNKDFQNAIASFDEAIEKDSNYAMANYAAAVASARANKVEDVVKYIKGAVSSNPDLKEMAVKDLEFRAFVGNALFSEALK
ncbi:MAG: hypothetical protein OEX22_01340 [Cyclobacteriaceae bacterium]|nr:hypothetical protein [Cyclobacteriaceae bacterium]